MLDNSENQGWFHFSRDIINPTLGTRNSVLHSICADNGIPSPRTLRHLEALQHKVDEVVDLSKTRWFCHLAEEIHNMPFDPKCEWENIKWLMGGEMSYHTAPRLIHMRLLSGSLTENDENNVSVFASHF